MNVRPADPADVTRLAELHEARIDEGFLATLGPAFLQRLYRRIVASRDAFACVAEDDRAHVVGFAAAAVDTSRLYREFALRDGVAAGARVAPRLARSWRRVVETLRYPAAGGDLPRAEILAVAVDAAAVGGGVGGLVVTAALAELERRGVRAARVVAGGDNTAALRLYARCGFTVREQIAVHAGTRSEVLVWRSS